MRSSIEGGYPGVPYPIVPGHEVAGRIDTVGPGAEPWRAGQRVGVGWYGRSTADAATAAGVATSSPAGQARIPGITFDGGYADYMIAPSAGARPGSRTSSPAEAAAPLLCAGITTFNALRHSGARAGDLVAVLGIGGLGHLALQFSARMGFETVAIARGKDKEGAGRYAGCTALSGQRDG